MTTPAFLRYTFIVSVAAMLTSCGGSQPPIGAPGAMPQDAASSPNYSVLHRFNSHGENHSGRPEAALINVGGTLYGSTFGKTEDDNGTVFSMSTTGKHTTLHRFHGRDGSHPWDAPLLDVNGTLYGTTYFGGGSGNGVVFSLTTAGVENVVYRFAGGSDGSHPWAGLIDVNGTLYGTTSFGGVSGCDSSQGKGCGTVYSISASGAEKVIYRFAGESDGARPAAGLLEVNGTLYGTTSSGGASGCGTVYRVSTSGSEEVLYSFASGSDGCYSIAPLIDVNGILYGTTLNGGTSGRGTVFSTSTAGKEKVLYSFAGGSDGNGPDAALLNVHGTLYGVTGTGGSSSCSLYGYSGCGTVYSVSTKGTEKVLYAFEGGADGALPQAVLVNVNGVLYGTTIYGGSSACYGQGCGTVFEITP